jgi:hypothetical protein
MLSRTTLLSQGYTTRTVTARKCDLTRLGSVASVEGEAGQAVPVRRRRHRVPSP